MPVTHFTPWDCNWPFGLPDDAVLPNNRDPDDPYDDQKQNPDNSCEEPGSIIKCQNQVVGQALAITGTPFTLNYQSDRVRGRSEYYTLEIPLRGDAHPPESVLFIKVVIDVAGQHFEPIIYRQPSPLGAQFPPEFPKTYLFEWNGKDAAGRTLQGAQPIRGYTGYVYPAVYMTPDAQAAQSFGLYPAGSVLVDRSLETITLKQYWQGLIGGWDARAQGLLGWSLSVHHAYDPIGRVLYLGDGRRRSIQGPNVSKIRTVAGTDTPGFNGDEIPATLAKLKNVQRIAVGPDGSLYISDKDNHRIRRVGPDGIITTVPGTAGQVVPNAVAVGPDGSLYVAEDQGIRQVRPDGTITPVANVFGASLIAMGPDGSLYIAEQDRIRRVGPDGIITIVAGAGAPAANASSITPMGITVGPDGSLYFADRDHHRIGRIRPDGIIESVAGSGNMPLHPGDTGDGGRAKDAKLKFPCGVAVGPDGSFYIADTDNFRIRRVRTNGIITTIAGTGVTGLPYTGDGGPATAAKLSHYGPFDIAVAPDGSLYIVASDGPRPGPNYWEKQPNYWECRVRQITPVFPGFSVTDIVIPAEDGASSTSSIVKVVISLL